MNDFVNPQNRGVDLPPGFKDLMDVLEAKGQVKKSKVRRPIIERHSAGGLAYVEKFLRRLLNSEAEISMLLILRADGSIAFELFRSQGSIKAEFCFPESDTAGEEVAKEVFAEVSAPTVSSMGVPGASHIVRTYALPASLADALELVTLVLRRAYEVSGKDGLGFYYHEQIL